MPETVRTPPDLAAAREQFLTMVDALRPDLHRYASRLVGSAIDGEDVVQDTLAKAFYAASQSPELPPIRPWLFRIARNTALDHLRRYENRNVDRYGEEEPMSQDGFPRDPEVLRAAVSTFLKLPATQRSAVILKDVLDESLDDIAEHLNTTVPAVKSLLVRGRQALKDHLAEQVDDAPVAPPSPEHRALVQQYVSLFNQRDWVGVQALLKEEVRLDLVSKSQRQGQAVGMYFGRYAQDTDVTLRAGRCEGREVLGVFRGGSTTPAYLILLESEEGKISFIKDFRYVPYMAESVEFLPYD